jgi:transketolase
MDKPALEAKARLIRSYILKMTTAAGSGHATSSLSAVELATALFFTYLDKEDHLIFSKGHATPLFYSLYAAAGKVSESDLMKYRTFDSVLEGHPTPRFKYTEAATGSLGQGLSIGVGEALALKLKQRDSHVWVFLGDGELAEGSVWEASAFASQRKLNNLIAIIDVNRLGQSDATAYEYHTEIYQRRFDAFGWSTLVIDGHDYSQICAAYDKVFIHKDGPVAIIAKTIKGKGVSFLEDKNGWHGKALLKDDLAKALKEVGS